MRFPTMQQVDAASREQLCRWHRELPSAKTADDCVIQARIHARYLESGGFTPDLSKLIGWAFK